MTLSRIRRAIGTFRTRQEAERALASLQDSHFPMDRVSMIARDNPHSNQSIERGVHDRPIGNKADEGAVAGAATGGAVGGITGLLVGLGLLAIPGIGPVMLAGAAATALATTLSGAAIGAATGGLLGALIGLGIPEAQARVYHDRVARGEYLVIVEGTEDELRHAEALLHQQGIEEWGIYDIPASTVDSRTVAPAPVPQTIVEPHTQTRVDRRLDVSVANEKVVPLYAERLVVDKHRQKTGEVAAHKHVETEAAKVAIPVEKERVVIERVNSPEIGHPVTPDSGSFQNTELLRVQVYEETADIRKQTFVREEVHLHKEVEQQVVHLDETLHREELDVQKRGNPIVDTDAVHRPDGI